MRLPGAYAAVHDLLYNRTCFVTAALCTNDMYGLTYLLTYSEINEEALSYTDAIETLINIFVVSPTLST